MKSLQIMEDTLSPRKYHILLTSGERQRLQDIVDQETKERATRAQELLLLDEGEEGPELSPKTVAERTGRSQTQVSRLLAKANSIGPVEAAIGSRSEANRRIGYRGGQPRSLSPEMEEQLLTDLASGQHTTAELARRFRVSRGTIYNTIKRSGQER